MAAEIDRRTNFIVGLSAVIAAAAALTRGAWRLVVAVRHRRELSRLADRDDRMLADIGLARSDLHDAGAEPLWHDPTSMLSRRVGHRRAGFERAARNSASRSCILGLLAGILGFIGVTQAVGEEACRPALAVMEVKFPKWQPPSMERTWTAVVSVDASRCAVNSAGYFEIGFARQKEDGVEDDFRERFIWRPPSVEVSVDFWFDEAVVAYWFNRVEPCPCRDGATAGRPEQTEVRIEANSQP